MIAHTNQIRAVSFVALLTFSFLAGVGGPSVVAVQGTISLDSSTYEETDTITVTVDDGDLATSEDYVVNIESDTESQLSVFGERPGTSITYTTNRSVADENADNKITELDIEYRDTDGGNNKIESLQRNQNGTYTITFENPPASNDALYYTRGETVLVTHNSGSVFIGTKQIDSADSKGVLQVSDGDSIISEYSDQSSNSIRTVSALVDQDPEPLTLGPLTEFTADTIAGTTLTHSESIIEIPFSEDVSKAGGESGGLTLPENISVSVDGVDVTDRYALDSDGSSDGQVVLSSSTAVDPRSTVRVTIDAVNDSLDTETIEPGSIDVTTASATVREDAGSTNGYEAETLAFLATDGSADLDQSFEVEDESGSFVFAGTTGPGSQLFTVDTSARNWSGGYAFTTLLDDGTRDRTVDLTLRTLELDVAIEDRNVTTADEIEGTITANSADRTVELAIRDSESTVVERRNRTLGGNGETPFAFDDSTLASVGPGNYTVAVTDAGSGASTASERIRVVDADERRTSFRIATVEEHAGDVVEFGVDLRYAETATVTIGGPEAGFRANVTVSDHGDGAVDVWFNTAAAVGVDDLPADGGDVFGVGAAGEGDGGSDDTIVATDIDPELTLSETIDPGEYPLAVRPGDDPTAPAEHTGTLLVHAAAPTGLTNLVAPSGTDVSTRDDLSAAIDSGRVTSAPAVAVGDVVVHRIVSPGLSGAFINQSGTSTEAFFALAGTDADSRYTLNLARHTSASNEGQHRLELTEENATVVADTANDTYFVAYDSDRISGFEAGDSLTASFAVNQTGPYSDLDGDGRTLTDDYALVAGAISTAADPVVVANATNQSIAGTTNAAPGTELELRIRSTDETEPSFLKTVRAVVGADGRWSATVDFDDQAVGDGFVVTSAVDVVSPVDELLVDGAVRAVLPSVTTETANVTTEALGGGSGGQSASNGRDGARGDSADRSDGSDRDPARTATAVPDSDTGEDESILDSTTGFVGGVLGTFIDNAGAESLRSRLLGFDVLVSLGALTTVALFAARRE